MRRSIVGAVVAALALFWVLGGLQSSRASAAEIDGAITSVTVAPASAGPFDPLKVTVGWAVPDSAGAGDTFTLTLPPQLEPLTRSFDLRSASGQVVAKAVVSGGLVTFTLTGYADTHTNVHGTAYFDVDFDLTEISGPGPVHLDFTTTTKVFPGTVVVTGNGIQDRDQPAKWGSWTDPTDQGSSDPKDAMTWGLESPQGPFDQVTLTDNGGAGMAFDCSTVHYYHAFGHDAFGRLTNVSALPASHLISSSCTPGRLAAVIGPLAAHEVVGVGYQTTITDPGRASYSNTARVTADGKDVPVQAEVARYDAGGSGHGSTPTSSPSSSSTSPTTSPTVSPTSTSTSSTSTTSTTSTTSSSTSRTSTSSTSPATVLPTKISHSPTSSAGSLPFTGSNVLPTLSLAALLLGGGLLLVLGARRPRRTRRH